jgi:hypothetical protein
LCSNVFANWYDWLPVPHDNIQDERISVYHLHPKSTNPDKDKQLLFRTSKSYYCPNDGSDQNYLNLVTTAMKSDEVSRLKLPTQIVIILLVTKTF